MGQGVDLGGDRSLNPNSKFSGKELIGLDWVNHPTTTGVGKEEG